MQWLVAIKIKCFFFIIQIACQNQNAIIIVLQCEWTIVNWPSLYASIVMVLELVRCVCPMCSLFLSILPFYLLIRLPQVTLDNNLLGLNMIFQTPAEHDSSITFSPRIQRTWADQFTLKLMPYYVNKTKHSDYYIKIIYQHRNQFPTTNKSDDWLREKERIKKMENAAYRERAMSIKVLNFISKCSQFLIKQLINLRANKGSYFNIIHHSMMKNVDLF